MEIVVRQATESDIDTLLQFERGVIEAERPFDKTIKDGDIHYYDLLEFIKSPDAEVVLAEAGNEPVGCGYAKIKPADPFLKHSRYVHLGCMYIKPGYRGQGINQMIINALVHWAKNKGLTEVRLEVYNNNEAAKKAYAKAGFTPNLLEMRMAIK